ncbi:MAG: hypothetical protein HY220_02515 [Candidatus Sungbacteria bacterium]|uniref:Uncharacterized protein n=1 Tax=Candidatus Sungiibacteriota bacterium TaxID=2750080 RepID=A0A9D6QS20_9BACT|nr:hypothetical protein [Candidatus Sungbacteria bacterium]
MTQEALTTELLSMRKRAERTAQGIDQISHNLSAERQSLRQVVKEYGTKRVELLKQTLQARGMTWCTYCSKAVPVNEVELLLVEGVEERSGGYENSCWGCEQFSKLHRACPYCRERAQDRHGTQGRYDSFNKLQACFYAFHVEKREDGHYARKFGNWVKLDDENCNLNEPSSQLIEKLAEEWNLPPRIEVESKWPSSEEKLIVHERALAEAS